MHACPRSAIPACGSLEQSVPGASPRASELIGLGRGLGVFYRSPGDVKHSQGCEPLHQVIRECGLDK